MAAMPIALQDFPNLQRQPVPAFPHVDAARRQPYPRPRGNRDHDRLREPISAAITDAANSGDVAGGIRTRTSLFTTTSIMVSGGETAFETDEATMTGENPEIASPNSRRQR